MANVSGTNPTGSKGPDLSSLKIEDRSRRSGKTGKILGIFAAALGVVVIIGGLYLRVRGQEPTVEVATARSGEEARNAPALLNASGYVTPRRRATVAAKITGRVEQVYAEEGMHVKAGQVLAILDCSQQNAALNSSKADRETTVASLADLQVQLGNAETELKRAQGLLAAAIGTQQAVDTNQTLVNSMKARIAYTREQVKSADARIAVSQQDVENCTVRSPYDGIVVSKDAQRGEIVSPVSAGGGFTRTGIATLVDMNSNEIEVDVNESFIARVKPGQRVSATLDAYPDWQIPSKVRTVIPTADRQKATVKVRISFDKLDPRILPDMGVKVAFLADESPTTSAKVLPKSLIPKSAVREDGGKKIVFLVRDGKLERRAVTVGPERGSDIEVLAGVSAGDIVVLRGPENLREGQSVKVSK
jgi:RND family efflux transporter MFP subunit